MLIWSGNPTGTCPSTPATRGICAASDRDRCARRREVEDQLPDPVFTVRAIEQLHNSAAIGEEVALDRYQISSLSANFVMARRGRAGRQAHQTGSGLRSPRRQVVRHHRVVNPFGRHRVGEPTRVSREQHAAASTTITDLNGE